MSKPEELTPESVVRESDNWRAYKSNWKCREDIVRAYGLQVARRCAEIAEEYAKGLSRGGLRHRGDLIADAIRREFGIEEEK